MTGLRCGIEIHQQLEGRKLFCGCPTTIRRDDAHFGITRELRASAGESGAVDQAAAYEQRKRKRFVYQGYRDSTCLVELDEEPIHPINPDALTAALQAAMLLGCTIIPELQVMRKVVIDGSNTSGFQRTILVGIDGHLEVDGDRITIPTLCLEEEACQVIERTDTRDTYNLSRLGIPLIEVATGPDITSPEQCQRVAARLGMILRSTGACKRGIGSIRQDVNVSTKGHPRVEIKGFQDLRSIPKILEGEIARQQEEVSKGGELTPHVRKAEPDLTTSYLRPMPGADRMYPETDHRPIIPDTASIKLPILLDEQLAQLCERYNLPAEQARQIIKHELPFLDYAERFTNVDARRIADILVKLPVELRRKQNVEYDIERDAPALLERLDRGELSVEAVAEVMLAQAKGERIDWQRYAPVDEAEVERVVRAVVAAEPDAPIGALMGRAMARLAGKADGKQVMAILRRVKG